MKVLSGVIVLEVLAVVLSIGIAMGHSTFTFITPDQFSNMLRAAGGVSPFIALIGMIVFREQLGSAIVIVAERIEGVSTPWGGVRLRSEAARFRAGESEIAAFLVAARLVANQTGVLTQLTAPEEDL